MGLEDIVNFIFKPMESLAKKIASYAPQVLQEGLNAIGKDYLTVKEFLMNYTLKPVDKAARKAYDAIQPAAKIFCENLDKKIIGPAIDYVKKNPWKVAALVTLPLALYLYAAYLPAYVGYRFPRAVESLSHIAENFA